MPLYEYQCRSCEHRFERIQKFSDPLATDCPECGGEVEKLISSPAFQFKGSGWYVTDYARKGEKSETEGKPADSNDTGSKESDKADKAKDTDKKADSSSDKAKDSGTKDSGSKPAPAKKDSAKE